MDLRYEDGRDLSPIWGIGDGLLSLELEKVGLRSSQSAENGTIEPFLCR